MLDTKTAQNDAYVGHLPETKCAASDRLTLCCVPLPRTDCARAWETFEGRIIRHRPVHFRAPWTFADPPETRRGVVGRGECLQDAVLRYAIGITEAP